MSHHETTPPIPLPGPRPETLRAAHLWAQAEIDAFPDSELVTINLDVETTASMILALAPRIAGLSPQITALAGIDRRRVENVGRYALACLAVNLAAERAGPRPGATAAMIAEAQPLRALLRVNADGLALAGCLPRAEVARIRSGRGLLHVASGLVALAELYHEHWDAIADKTPVTRPEIERSLTLGTAMLKAIGGRDLDPDPSVGAEDPLRARHRAFSLLLAAYDECRRGVVFLRWREGDADTFTPSLYRRRRRRRAEVDVKEGAANDATAAVGGRQGTGDDDGREATPSSVDVSA